MSYKTVKFGAVLDRVMRARGLNPDETTLTTMERAHYGEILTRVVGRAWNETRWPQLLAYEERTSRPPWQVTVNYSLGMQVWDETTEMYWESLEDSNVGNHPPATKAADAHWMPAVDMKFYIQLAQPWEANEIDEDGVDERDFAYYDDPIGNPDARPIQGCRRIANSVVLPNLPDVPGKVWIKYKPAAPRFALALWNGATPYGAGELVYWENTRECYLSTRATTNEEPEATVDGGNPWAPVGFPAMFEDYAVLAAASELQSEDEGKYKTRALAEEELERVVHRKTSAAGRPGRVVVGRRR